MIDKNLENRLANLRTANEESKKITRESDAE